MLRDDIASASASFFRPPKRRRPRLRALALALPSLGLLVLWWAGPPPIQSGLYIRSVTPTSAVIVRFDAAPARVLVQVLPDPGGGAPVPPAVAESSERRDHAVRVEGLVPDTRYRVVMEDLGPDGTVSRTDRGAFRTAPKVDQAPVRFVAVGDTGHSPRWARFGSPLGWTRLRPALAWLGDLGGQWDLARQMERLEPDLFVHLGDVVYPRGKPALWEEAFFRPFAGLLRRTMLAGVPGNHDVQTDRGAMFLDVFHGATDRPDPPPWSTFAWGPARFVLLETSRIEVAGAMDTSTEAEQTRWLAATLAAATEPWLIVVQHHPYFCSSVHRDEPQLIRDWWPLLRKHRVDLVLSGHSHNYLRYHPIDGVVQVVAGAGGYSTYDIRPDPRLAAATLDVSCLCVEIDGLTLRGELVGADGRRRDGFELDQRQHSRVPEASPRGARIAQLRAEASAPKAR